jgi:hypothetical protein
MRAQDKERISMALRVLTGLALLALAAVAAGGTHGSVVFG